MTLQVEVPGEKIITVEPCKCNSETKYGANLKKSTKITIRFKEVLKSFWSAKYKITVEPLVLCYILPSMLAGLAVQNLCLEKSCLVNLKFDDTTCQHIMDGRTSNYTSEEAEVQKLVTSMTGWSIPLQTALPGILTLFVGAWSDRTGNRKMFMVLPIFGKLVSVIGVMLSTVFFHRVGLIETALIDALPPAMAGGRVAMTMAVYSYITDITTDKDRTFRLGIVTAVLTLSRPVGLALSGISTKTFGYYGVFSIASVFYMTGFVYITLRLKSKKKKVVDSDKGLSMLPMQDLMATVTVAFKERPQWHRLKLLLIMFAYMFIVGPLLGEGQMTYWFTRYKYKFTEVDYSLFLTYSLLVGCIGSFITIYVFVKRWNMRDGVVGIIACVSRIAASIIYAVAPNRSIYFIGPVLDMFSSAGATSLRSIATKLVNADEVGKTSSLISISEALVPVVYSPIYSRVYLNTFTSFPGAFYLISAVLAIPAIFILLLILFLSNDDQTEVPPVEEKTKTKDNEITRF